MDSAIAKQLVDKIYEKRKAAALDLEKQIRDCHAQNDHRRIHLIIDQLVDMFSNPSNPLHLRNGGLIGLAGTAIALGVEIAPYMDKFITPLLDCFVDTENRIRYFSAECLYNIAKVSKGEILVYFNDIFDALSKLAADSELSVKNGAELLDRLLKDIIAETASVYVPQFPETTKVTQERDNASSQLNLTSSASNPSSDGGVLFSYQDTRDTGYPGVSRAFSLAHFIPLLRDRIYVVSPFTRSFLVSWITVLDSVPELELITFLPDFLDGLLKYLSDPTEDVRVATEVLLSEFLREIRDITNVRKRAENKAKQKRDSDSVHTKRDNESDMQRSTTDLVESEKQAFLPVNGVGSDSRSGIEDGKDDFGTDDIDYRDAGVWVPGQGVRIDYPAIIQILIDQLDSEHDEIQQSTSLLWLSEFLSFASEVMVPFTPRLIPAILPNLAHHVPMIQSAAIRTNKGLLGVVQALPSPGDMSASVPSTTGTTTTGPSPAGRPPSEKLAPSVRSQSGTKDGPSIGLSGPSTDTLDAPLTINIKSRGSGLDMTRPNEVSPPGTAALVAGERSRPHSPLSVTSQSASGSAVQAQAQAQAAQGTSQSQALSSSATLEKDETDLLDYQQTVNELTVQFLSEFEETRVAALKWLIMLHQKAPKKILAMDDGTFPALLKTLSDSSEEVIKHDLQLLAQISSSSEESYFKAFMNNLLELFSTDRTLLDTRGSLIIRQLCMNLNTERIYRTFAEILEKEDDLEFASDIVQKLHIILITSPELADFRKRLKNLENRSDGQALFTTLYRSWCHNAVSVFSLCLLAQAYEHASNLLHIFAELEITVQMLVQIDKLVQLIESPVFTYLRLQLLEPERYPHLFKCLYGILMLLPQSLAFVSLRNRLNAVGFLHIGPKSTPSHSTTTRSKFTREEIKWQDLLQHFRYVQNRHEKARRQALGSDLASGGHPFASEEERYALSNNTGSSLSMDQGYGAGEASSSRLGASTTGSSSGGRPYMRRKMTGEGIGPGGTPLVGGSSSGLAPRGVGVLSPLNPKVRAQQGFFGSISQAVSGGSGGGGGSAAGSSSTVQSSQGAGMSPTQTPKGLAPVQSGQGQGGVAQKRVASTNVRKL